MLLVNAIFSRIRDSELIYQERLTNRLFAALIGEKQVFYWSQDDKARITLGVTAAKHQAPILMRYESHYRIRLPDHDFPVGREHKLIPSVYAAEVAEAATRTQQLRILLRSLFS